MIIYYELNFDTNKNVDVMKANNVDPTIWTNVVDKQTLTHIIMISFDGLSLGRICQSFLSIKCCLGDSLSVTLSPVNPILHVLWWSYSLSDLQINVRNTRLNPQDVFMYAFSNSLLWSAFFQLLPREFPGEDAVENVRLGPREVKENEC